MDCRKKYKIIEPTLNITKSNWDITRETGLSNGMINKKVLKVWFSKKSWKCIIKIFKEEFY